MKKREVTYQLIGALRGAEPRKHLHFHNGHVGRAATPHITEGRKKQAFVSPRFSLSADSIPTHTQTHTYTHTHPNSASMIQVPPPQPLLSSPGVDRESQGSR